jgi:hypothetical protein
MKPPVTAYCNPGDDTSDGPAAGTSITVTPVIPLLLQNRYNNRPAAAGARGSLGNQGVWGVTGLQVPEVAAAVVFSVLPPWMEGSYSWLEGDQGIKCKKCLRHRPKGTVRRRRHAGDARARHITRCNFFHIGG